MWLSDPSEREEDNCGPGSLMKPLMGAERQQTWLETSSLCRCKPVRYTSDVWFSWALLPLYGFCPKGARGSVLNRCVQWV